MIRMAIYSTQKITLISPKFSLNFCHNKNSQLSLVKRIDQTLVISLIYIMFNIIIRDIAHIV